MAATAQPAQPGSNTLSSLLGRYGPTLFCIVWVLAANTFLHSIDRTMLLHPLWASIAFPMLAISPFLIISMRIPRPIQIILAGVVGLILLPLIGIEDTSYLELIIQISIFGAMAVGLNIVVGLAGLLDLGYIAFFAVGAYLWGVFTSQAETVVRLSGATAAPEAFWIFLFLGVIAAAITGILLGLPVLRLRGDYLAIVTLGFGEMIRIFASNLSNISSNPRARVNITNGAQGLHGISHPPIPDFFSEIVRQVGLLLGKPDYYRVPQFPNFVVDFTQPFAPGLTASVVTTNLEATTLQLFFYFLVLAVGGIAILVSMRVENSPIGRAWTAIREDETAALAMGVPRVRMKLLAFAMGASFAGAMGVIFAAKNSFVSPESFSFIQSIFILAVVIVGGMGSIRGVLLGAVVVTLLNLQVLKNFSLLINNLRNQGVLAWWPPQLEPARYERLVFGLLLILMMIFRPAGILPAKRRRLEMLREEPIPVPDTPDTPAEPRQEE